MTRTYRFVRSLGTTDVHLEDGTLLRLPVFPGILKHPPPDQLFSLLQDEAAARKYTRLALQKAAWQVLREFPRGWLVSCLAETEMREGRRRALDYMLGDAEKRRRILEDLRR